MTNQGDLSSSRDLQIEILHDLLGSCRVIEEASFEFNLALFDHFEVSAHGLPDIKC